MPIWLELLLALVVAFALSFAATPIVKSFARIVGAMDVPKDSRRMHKNPIPRMGGLAIFIGFLLSTVLFCDITKQMQGILIGAVIIVAAGAIDDIVSLNAWVKLGLQVIAAVVAVGYDVVIEVFLNPVIFGKGDFELGILAVPVTVVWIVAVTNAVNLIDGLDGLACGVSTISSVTMLVVAMIVSEPNVAIVLAALAGGCIGFIPYNINPAKIFMGDTGSQLLGYVLATVSVVGLFKFYALFTFAVPLLALAFPILDTAFAIVRRVLKGQSPFHPDRGHLHHRLIDMGFTQKQAVAVLYAISTVMGLVAMVVATTGTTKVLLLAIALTIAGFIGGYVLRTYTLHEQQAQNEEAEETGEKNEEN
ncbi:MAG: undecaprenyl/decaprenyl-phosphate alpha-N-acetylglucosaminyl 1-phosphate transferase [Oscillospiraceae bacterium]|nr:undecaprenyl/decaprenyl-phosphate alpha-N-acetylglucosaminyl 1-phosphate transferase [Oscillospiraceae bacterium]